MAEKSRRFVCLFDAFLKLVYEIDFIILHKKEIRKLWKMQIYKVIKRVYHILINEIDIIFLQAFNKKNQTGKKRGKEDADEAQNNFFGY